MSRAVEEPLPGWCILVVDDSPDERAEVRRMLLKGCDRQLTFIEAPTAQAAIAAVRGALVLPDCMVLDYYLPDMDAPDVLQAIKGPDGMPVCPVVVLTGGISRDDGRRVLRAGAQDYIGKDWTSPQSLNRAIENACESWAMAHELRERRQALRVTSDRDAFRTAFGDATRNLVNERDVKRVASKLLGRYLSANRLVYAELTDDESVVVEPGYVSGVQQIDGVYRLADYGPALLTTLRAGHSVHVSDIQQEPGYSAAERLAYAGMQIVSFLAIPILKNGRLVAIVCVHQKTPRVWAHDDLLMVREIAERTWAAVEQARSEAKLLASRVQLTQVVAIMPSFSAVLRGPGHVFEMANQAFYDLVQHGPEILGLTYAQALPELASQGFLDLLDKAYRSGENFEAKGMRAFVQRGLGNVLTEVFIDFVYLPLREANGLVSGIFLHGVDRTEQVRSEQALRRSQQELQTLADNIPDILSRFDRHLRFVFMNAAGEKATGLRKADFLGKTNRDMGIPEVICQQWEGASRTVFNTGVEQILEFELDGPQGSRHYASRLVPEFDADGHVEFVLEITSDVTQRKLAMDLLRRSELRLEVALKNSRTLVYTTDHELRYTWIRNPHPAFDPATVLGHRDEDLLPPEKAEPLIRLKRAVFESGVGQRSEYAVEIDGIQYCYDMTVEPLRGAAGNMEGLTVAALEISDRKQTEETLRNADRRKDEFLATLAHELRNPLAPIRTGLQLVKRAPEADVHAVVARTLPVMERQLGQLVRLIDDLLDVSRISSGKIVLKREQICFNDIAAAALEASQPLIDAAQHTLTLDWPKEPVWLDADPTRIAQVFTNLLTNSAKYMRAGGHIKFSAVRRGDNVVVSVQDTGMGIPADMLGSVFDMFTQGHHTFDSAQGGLGIGLSLVKTLVELHGGTVGVSSGGVDLGSTFTVVLPTTPTPTPLPQWPTGPARSGAAAPACHRILVVDDNVDAAETLVMLLDACGHDARAAFGAQEALDMAMTWQPDVVFLDIGLPGKDGYDVARQLQAAPETASATLIALTGWGSAQAIQKSKQAGFHTHLTKPVDPEAVMTLLAALAGKN